MRAPRNRASASPISDCRTALSRSLLWIAARRLLLRQRHEPRVEHGARHAQRDTRKAAGIHRVNGHAVERADLAPRRLIVADQRVGVRHE